MASTTILFQASMADFRLPQGFWHSLLRPRHLLQILMWPCFCAVVAALLWALVFHRTDSDRRHIEKTLLSQTSALARAVAKGVSLSVTHVDELSIALQAHWEREHPSRDAEQFAHNTDLRRNWLNYVGVTNRSGRVIGSWAAIAAMPSLAGEECFQFHRDNPSRALHIGASRNHGAGLPSISFSRRLNAADGSFDGLVVLNVRPGYLTGYYDEASFGKRGYLGIRGADATH